MWCRTLRVKAENAVKRENEITHIHPRNLQNKHKETMKYPYNLHRQNEERQGYPFNHKQLFRETFNRKLLFCRAKKERVRRPLETGTKKGNGKNWHNERDRISGKREKCVYR